MVKPTYSNDINKYVFRPSHHIFPLLFNIQKTKLHDHLGKGVVIEHIGSTAIAGLSGKGIIDIMVGIQRGKHAFPELTKKLEKAGWEHRAKADTLERIFFRKDLPDEIEKIRRYHLHLTYFNGKDWKEAINFRDNLIDSPTLREEYEAIKKNAIKKANKVGEIYRKIKEPFIAKYSK